MDFRFHTRRLRENAYDIFGSLNLRMTTTTTSSKVEVWHFSRGLGLAKVYHMVCHSSCLCPQIADGSSLVRSFTRFFTRFSRCTCSPQYPIPLVRAFTRCFLTVLSVGMAPPSCRAEWLNRVKLRYLSPFRPMELTFVRNYGLLPLATRPHPRP
jgi:hypothetical protein